MPFFVCLLSKVVQFFVKFPELNMKIEFVALLNCGGRYCWVGSLIGLLVDCVRKKKWTLYIAGGFFVSVFVVKYSLKPVFHGGIVFHVAELVGKVDLLSYLII